jgi:hypothetical protein
MSSRVHRFQEVRRLGGEYGRELAAALVLASSRTADRALKRQMARIVLRQIAAAVEKLKNAAFPAELTLVYERAARQGVHEELLKNQEIAARLHRHAA